MDKRIGELARLAWHVAAEINDLKLSGDVPPVILHEGLKGSKNGGYRSTKIFGKVLWDSIWVTNSASFIWPVLVHEMTHCLRRRNGLPLDEKAGYRAGDLAIHKYNLPQVHQLLAQLYEE